MARKSNKTEQVLKLITKHSEPEDKEPAVNEPEDKEPKDKEPAVSEPEDKEPENKEPAVSEPKKNEITDDTPPNKSYSSFLEKDNHPVNLAEILAGEKLELVMGKMKVCTCGTCVNDVLALALNSLPAKYVTDPKKIDLQLELYKNQYTTDILAALTKSCVRVKAVPRHKTG